MALLTRFTATSPPYVMPQEGHSPLAAFAVHPGLTVAGALLEKR